MLKVKRKGKNSTIGDCVKKVVRADESKSVIKGTCCVCGHSLADHVDEGAVWRCHCLGPDGYQCECTLRKERYPRSIEGYSLEKRVKQFVADLQNEREHAMLD
jgi:hypothetical protein